jgi:hypothetical protein
VTCRDQAFASVEGLNQLEVEQCVGESSSSDQGHLHNTILTEGKEQMENRGEREWYAPSLWIG